ncbi:acyltransferase family protein [Actibacterium pelagium]|nr:acyltransferase family protein [Actibacterium pelagium]
MKYRPEIDGLRGVAVTIVVLFHAGLESFGGGFVGVDVFFVISGFLIASILLEDMKTRSVDLIGFYVRRMRRILPALFVTVGLTIPMAGLILLPGDLRGYAESLIGVAIFSSNYVFANNAGYFAPAAELQPLLHTWSLAVEVQFYLAVPFLFIMTLRIGWASLPAVLLCVFAFSLAISEWAVAAKPEHAFFYLPYRGWELLTGCLVALVPREWIGKVPVWVATLLAYSGLVAILWATFSYDKNTAFPGFNALLPTSGAVLVLLFSRASLKFYRLLTNKILVGLGLISYSLYLVHQPLFAFASYLSVEEISNFIVIALIGVSLILAYYSWRFVELPARSRKQGSKSIWLTRPFLTSVLVCFATFSIGISLLAQPEDKLRPNRGFTASCFHEEDLKIACGGSETSEQSIIIFGDSYAMHLAGMFEAVHPNASFLQITKSACSPIAGLAQIRPGTSYDSDWAADCIQHNAASIEFISKRPPSTVILGTPFTNTIENSLIDLDGTTLIGDQVNITAKGISNTVESFLGAGHSVIIVEPPLNSGVDLGRCVMLSQKIGRSERCNFSYQSLSERSRNARMVTAKLAERYRILALSPLYCDEELCVPAKEGISLFRDAGHLSIEGAHWIGSRLTKPQLEAVTNYPAK